MTLHGYHSRTSIKPLSTERANISRWTDIGPKEIMPQRKCSDALIDRTTDRPLEFVEDIKSKIRFKVLKRVRLPLKPIYTENRTKLTLIQIFFNAYLSLFNGLFNKSFENIYFVTLLCKHLRFFFHNFVLNIWQIYECLKFLMTENDSPT